MILLSALRSRPDKRSLNQIAELFRGELISFEVGDDSPLAVDDDGVQGVSDHTHFLPEIEIEFVADLLDLWQRPGEEVPVSRVGVPGLCVFG